MKIIKRVDLVTPYNRFDWFTLYVTPENADEIVRVWEAQMTFKPYVFHVPSGDNLNTFIIWDTVNMDKVEAYLRK